jgi:hypothetical protein
MRDRIRNADVAFELRSVPEVGQFSPDTADEDTTGTAAFSVRDEGAAALPDGSFPGISAERLEMLLRTDPRDDSDVRRDVLRALMLDSLVPLSIDVHVQDGIVTLTGTASWRRERDDAVYLAGGVPGVLGVIDNLVLIPAPRDGAGH